VVWIICNLRRRKCSVCVLQIYFFEIQKISFSFCGIIFSLWRKHPRTEVNWYYICWDLFINTSNRIAIVLSRSAPFKAGSCLTALCIYIMQQDFWVKNRVVEGNLLLVDHRTLWRCSVRLCVFRWFCFLCVIMVHILNFI